MSFARLGSSGALLHLPRWAPNLLLRSVYSHAILRALALIHVECRRVFDTTLGEWPVRRNHHVLTSSSHGSVSESRTCSLGILTKVTPPRSTVCSRPLFPLRYAERACSPSVWRLPAPRTCAPCLKAASCRRRHITPGSTCSPRVSVRMKSCASSSLPTQNAILGLVRLSVSNLFAITTMRSILNSNGRPKPRPCSPSTPAETLPHPQPYMRPLPLWPLEYRVVIISPSRYLPAHKQRTANLHLP